MRLAVMLAFCAGCLTLDVQADPCVAGSLASYVSLGTTGCTIGTNVVSSFSVLTGFTGATELSPGTVSITPLGGSSDPELEFTVNDSVDASPALETIFTYRIAGNPYTQSEINLSNSSETGEGAVTDLQNICEDGSFGSDGVDGCPGVSDSLLTLDGIQNTDNTPLSALSFLSVTDDFTLDPGPAGSAAGGVFTDQFTARTTVPEPKLTVLLGALVLALAAACKRR
ncbi:MAG: hypothetical protein ABSE86_33555 [Bryobacteraceae bacterium]|jgi:hypothetical protein